MAVQVYGCNHVVIEVTDAKKAVKFYQNVFGLKMLRGGEGAAWCKHSAARHCAGWEVVISRLDPAAPRSARHSQSDDCNTQKLDHWADAVAWAPEGMPILLIDSDTVIVGDLSPTWSQPFDLAYPLRERGARLPLNAGVVFLRASPAVKRFVTAWRQENGRMLEDRAYHERWRRLYGGINQAALSKLLDWGVSRDLGLTLAQLPCRTWNCEHSAWQHFGLTPGSSTARVREEDLPSGRGVMEVRLPARPPRQFS